MLLSSRPVVNKYSGERYERDQRGNDLCECLFESDHKVSSMSPSFKKMSQQESNVMHRCIGQRNGESTWTESVSVLSTLRKHDCTFKESLYSTHPYLTFSNKSQPQPVMTN